MPWSPEDAAGHTSAVLGDGRAARQWAHVANGELAAGKSEGGAVAIANGVAKKRRLGSGLTKGTGNPYRKGLAGIGV